MSEVQDPNHYSPTTTIMDSFSSTRSNDNMITSNAPQNATDNTLDTNTPDAPSLAAQYLQQTSRPNTQQGSYANTTNQTANTSSIDAEQPPAKKQRNYTFLPNTELYNKWAPTYDSDGNILQGLDSWKLYGGYMTRFLDALAARSPASDDAGTLKLVDLGCGTGRGTVALIDAFTSAEHANYTEKLLGSKGKRERKVHIRCLEVAEEMMNLARPKIQKALEHASSQGVDISVDFEVYDMYNVPQDAKPGSSYAAHGLISTLVLEHLPLPIFFAQGVAPLLSVGGIALVTNMHEDMGTTLPTVAHSEKGSEAITGAGFNSTNKTEKFRAAVDFAHTTPETLSVAKNVASLEAVRDVSGKMADEVRVESWMVFGDVVDGKVVRTAVLGERGRKWIGIKCWVGFIFRRG